MTRCPTKGPDGRQCCRPEHAGPHLLAATWPDRDALLKIAAAWGYGPGAANAAVSGAMSRGRLPSDKFVRMLEAMAGALSEAMGRGHA